MSQYIDKSTKSNVKKPIFKKWWFWVIIVVLSAIFGNMGNNEDEQANSDTTVSQETSESIESETEVESDSDTLPVEIDGGCRALTKNFIEGAVGEDYSAFA